MFPDSEWPDIRSPLYKYKSVDLYKLLKLVKSNRKHQSKKFSSWWLRVDGWMLQRKAQLTDNNLVKNTNKINFCI